MCDGLADEAWHSVGVTPWSGNLCVFEQCGQCLGFRARVLDPDEIDVVTGTPSPSTESPAPDQESESDNAQGPTETSHDDDDDWLVG